MAAVAYDLSFLIGNTLFLVSKSAAFGLSATYEDYIYSGPTTPHSQTDLSSPARPISTAVTAQLPTCSESFQGYEDQKSPGPELVRHYPQTLAITTTNAAKTARKKGKSKIWTSTPEKNRLEEELREKNRKS